MARRIGVMGATPRSGETVASLLIALALQYYSKQKVCWTSTGARFNDAKLYTGISNEDFDPTRSMDSFLSLLRSGTMTSAKLGSYLHSIIKDGFEMLIPSYTTDVTDLRDLEDLHRLAIQYMDHDYIVTAISAGTSVAMVREQLNECDLIFLVIDQDVANLEKAKLMLESKSMKENMNKICLLVNRYDSTISSIDTLSRSLGFSRGERAATISYNPYLTLSANEGEIHFAVEDAYNEDIALLNIGFDLSWIMQVIAHNLPDSALLRYFETR